MARGDVCLAGPLDCILCGPISFRNPLGRLGWDRGFIGAGLAWGINPCCPPELHEPRDEGVVVPVDRDGVQSRYVCMVHTLRLEPARLLIRTLEELAGDLNCHSFGIIGLGRRDDGRSSVEAVRHVALAHPGLLERVVFCDRRDPLPFLLRLRERGMLPGEVPG